jgi:hypothetical protein
MRKFLYPLLILFACGVFSAPTFAQETDEPTPEVTPVVTEAPPVEPAPEPEQPTGETLVGRIAGYVGSYIAGAVTIVGAGLAFLPRLLSYVRNDKLSLTMAEGLVKSVPQEFAIKLILAGKAAGDLSAIIEEATDETPVISKPPTA